MLNPFALFVVFFGAIAVCFKMFVIAVELTVSLIIFLFSLLRKDKKEEENKEVKNIKEVKNDK